MTFRLFLAALGLAAVSACSSVPTTEALVATGNPLADTPDWELIGEDVALHTPSGGKCPEMLGEFIRKSYDLLEITLDDITRFDGVCQYQNLDTVSEITVYFYPATGETLLEHMRSFVVAPILQRWKSSQFLKEESQACNNSLQMITGVAETLRDVLSQMAGGTPDETIHIVLDEGVGQCAIFTVPEFKGKTYATLDEVNGWFMKIRLTEYLPSDANSQKAMEAIIAFHDTQNEVGSVLEALAKSPG